MNLCQSISICSRMCVATAIAMALLLASVGSVAQAPAPPPPAPMPPGAVAPTPPPPPAAAPAVAPAAAPAGIDPMKEREIIDFIVNGKTSVQGLDLATAQMYFEQAFAKCDEYQEGSQNGPWCKAYLCE